MLSYQFLYHYLYDIGIVFKSFTMSKKSILFLIVLFLTSFSLVFSQEKNNTAKSAKPLIVYGSDSCPHCIATKEFLDKKKVEYKFLDIDKDIEALKEMFDKLKKANISLSNIEIPVIDNNGVVFTNTANFQDFLDKLNKL